MLFVKGVIRCIFLENVLIEQEEIQKVSHVHIERQPCGTLLRQSSYHQDERFLLLSWHIAMLISKHPSRFFFPVLGLLSTANSGGIEAHQMICLLLSLMVKFGRTFFNMRGHHSCLILILMVWYSTLIGFSRTNTFLIRWECCTFLS